MRIVIDVDAVDPPAGRLLAAARSRHDGEQITVFAGWLGLLHALSEAMDVPPLHEIPHMGDERRLAPRHDH